MPGAAISEDEFAQFCSYTEKQKADCMELYLIKGMNQQEVQEMVFGDVSKFAHRVSLIHRCYNFSGKNSGKYRDGCRFEQKYGYQISRKDIVAFIETYPYGTFENGVTFEDFLLAQLEAESEELEDNADFGGNGFQYSRRTGNVYKRDDFERDDYERNDSDCEEDLQLIESILGRLVTNAILNIKMEKRNREYKEVRVRPHRSGWLLLRLLKVCVPFKWKVSKRTGKSKMSIPAGIYCGFMLIFFSFLNMIMVSFPIVMGWFFTIIWSMILVAGLMPYIKACYYLLINKEYYVEVREASFFNEQRKSFDLLGMVLNCVAVVILFMITKVLFSAGSTNSTRLLLIPTILFIVVPALTAPVNKL